MPFITTIIINFQNPPFADGSTSHDITQFLQECKEVPHLDMFSDEQSMSIDAALVR